MTSTLEKQCTFERAMGALEEAAMPLAEDGRLYDGVRAVLESIRDNLSEEVIRAGQEGAFPQDQFKAMINAILEGK